MDRSESAYFSLINGVIHHQHETLELRLTASFPVPSRLSPFHDIPQPSTYIIAHLFTLLHVAA